MKVSELMPPLLDYWVGKAENVNPSIIKGRCYSDASEVANGGLGYWEPSTNWRLGGPIIERERMEIEPSTMEFVVTNTLNFSLQAYQAFRHKHLLIAAMRCFVACKFGEEVPDEADQ